MIPAWKRQQLATCYPAESALGAIKAGLEVAQKYGRPVDVPKLLAVIAEAEAKSRRTAEFGNKRLRAKAFSVEDLILRRDPEDASRSDCWFAWHPVRVGALGTGSFAWLSKVWRNRCCGVTIYQPLD